MITNTCRIRIEYLHSCFVQQRCAWCATDKVCPTHEAAAGNAHISLRWHSGEPGNLRRLRPARLTTTPAHTRESSCPPQHSQWSARQQRLYCLRSAERVPHTATAQSKLGPSPILSPRSEPHHHRNLRKTHWTYLKTSKTCEHVQKMLKKFLEKVLRKKC